MPSFYVNRQFYGTDRKERHGFFRSALYTGEGTENISGIWAYKGRRGRFLGFEGGFTNLRFDALCENLTLIRLLYYLNHIKGQIQRGFMGVTPGGE